MAGLGKLALTALAMGLLPFEVKRGDNGEFKYKSLLVGVDTRKDDDGKQVVELKFFNLPEFMKKTAPEAEAPEGEAAPEAEADVTITIEKEEVPVEEAPAEEAPVEEAPVEEAPVEEVPVEEAPVEETPVEETPAE